MQTVRRYWRIISPIIVALVIWIFSSQTGDVSDSKSLKVAQIFGLDNETARTLAHFILFGSLGYTLCSFIKGLYPQAFPTLNLIAYPIIVVTVFGAIDEVHQITVIGRNAKIGEIFIDTLAGFSGILLYVAVFCFWRLFLRHRKIIKIQNA